MYESIRDMAFRDMASRDMAFLDMASLDSKKIQIVLLLSLPKLHWPYL
jgi:hypothetical protein